MSGLFNRLRDNIADVLTFGPRFLLRYAPLITGASLASVELPGVGAVHLRSGESDVEVVRQVFRRHEYDVGIAPAVQARIERRYCDIVEASRIPVIVDAGANIGIATLWFKQRFPAAHVVALEPEPGNLAILHKNVGDIAGVTVLDNPIGSTSGFAVVRNGELGWAAKTQRAEQGIPVVTMAEAFGKVANGTPFIAKIDIEGFESDLFAANVDWLQDVFAVYIEPHDWMLPGAATSRNFQRVMGNANFEIFVNGENLLYVRV
jgi:FkbM family methyltransferase